MSRSVRISARRSCIRKRGAHGALGVVLVRDRRAEQRDERVADHLVHLTAERRDLDREPLEAAVDEVLDLLRVGRLRKRREPDQVGEEHRRDASLVRARDEAVAARRAEARVSRSGAPARRTGHDVMVGPNVSRHGRDRRPNALKFAGGRRRVPIGTLDRMSLLHDRRLALLVAGQALNGIGSWCAIVALWGFASFRFDAGPGAIAVLGLAWALPPAAPRPARRGADRPASARSG